MPKKRKPNKKKKNLGNCLLIKQEGKDVSIQVKNTKECKPVSKKFKKLLDETVAQGGETIYRTSED